MLITNISSLQGVSQSPPLFKKGVEMSNLPRIQNAFLLIEDGKITDFGNMTDAPERSDQQIDAKGGIVLPAWCDSHSHIVFAKSRENEFVDKIRGMTYEEIAARGGGILNSANLLRNTDEEILLEKAYTRLNEVIRTGTGALEIKSGYGLDLESELKMLRVIRSLKLMSAVEIKASFLGAHAVPKEYKNKREKYIKLIIERMLPQVAEENLAEYVDVFCDIGFFTVKETDRILNAASKYGLKAKIHANELANSGGVQVGIKNQAVSVDHLERIGENEILALQKSTTIPTLLPGTSFFLKIPYAQGRKMIDAGLGIALASDFNPGSSPSGNIPFILSLACIYMQLLPEEAINASTINGAYAMELNQTHGSITKGKVANLIITKPLESIWCLPYYYGSPTIHQVILKGKIHYSA